jgi:hypothetical protein
MDEEYRAKVRAGMRIHERARELRGRFLNLVAAIEHDIAHMLTEYFCTNDETKRVIFFDRIASAMSLNVKRDVLIEIVKRDYPRYWDEHSQFLQDLQRIQEFRNKLAHSIVDVSDAALARPLEEGIGFVQWNKGKPINDRESDDWEVRANMVISTLEEIKRMLPFKERPIA